MMKSYSIAVDFDGVLHSYTSPWVAEDVIPDPPVDGAIAWLLEMVRRFEVVIHTTRGKTADGQEAVRRWLVEHATAHLGEAARDSGALTMIMGLAVTAEKVPALVYIDDRAWRFQGAFPTADEIHRARPWNKP